MNHLQYLAVLVGCLALTLPLELLGSARVYHRPRRAVQALLGPLVIFSLLDDAGAASHLWSYNSSYVLGWRLPGGLPIEEVMFFAVVPLCALLTFDCLDHFWGRRGAGLHRGRRGR